MIFHFSRAISIEQLFFPHIFWIGNLRTIDKLNYKEPELHFFSIKF